MTHQELIDKGVEWLSNNKNHCYRSPVILTELRSHSRETPDIMGMNPNLSTVIECKTTLDDFRADLKKSHRSQTPGMGNFRFYLCPKDIIPVPLVPYGWGLLYCEPTRISIRKQPQSHYEGVREEEYHILYSVVHRVTMRGLMEEIKKPLM